MDVERIKKDTIKHFDKQWGQIYASFDSFGSNRDFTSHLLKCTNTIASDWEGKSAFEGGSGSGRNTLAVLQLGVKSIVATDISPMAVKSILRNIKKDYLNIQGYPTDLAKLDAELDNTYDITFSVNCLPHIPDVLNALKEMVRVTKKGGMVCFNLPPKRPDIIARNDKAIRELTTKMEHSELTGACKLIVHFANTKDLSSALIGITELSGDMLSAYDHFGLPFTSEFTKEQVCDLCKEAGIEILAIDDKISVKGRKI